MSQRLVEDADIDSDEWTRRTPMGVDPCVGSRAKSRAQKALGSKVHPKGSHGRVEGGDQRSNHMRQALCHTWNKTTHAMLPRSTTSLSRTNAFLTRLQYYSLALSSLHSDKAHTLHPSTSKHRAKHGETLRGNRPVMTSAEEITHKSDYPYSWDAEDHSLTLDEFLAKYRPSMVQNDGSKPWVQVKRNSPSGMISKSASKEAIDAARAHIAQTAINIEEINNNPSIPARSSKKTGAKSKKEVREALSASSARELSDIAIKHEFTSGKWSIFMKSNTIDDAWKKVAQSLISGPLSETPAYLVRASTSPANEASSSASPPHVLSVQIPNILDKDEATNVLRVLLRNHGFSAPTAKPDLYSAISLDSKHKSGIRSTVWQVKELVGENEIANLLKEYTSRQGEAKARQKALASRSQP
ncbi:hypothetical protein BS47DRAFT_468098 [Hydnum rufescens UP504]|uniref:Uncharacterized protein n=1 Tax=Hydnum rufescens UP504 TaxID=1448309 RepID=A0A9P6B4R2_9AGAM|nr:hypothetical protein BS47DRAFT_468098 [Hydnum rufescens UP504]